MKKAMEVLEEEREEMELVNKMETLIKKEEQALALLAFFFLLDTDLKL